ncbi:mlr0096 [Mesorhizobium japonicum MAFF 303099]|uniref:Mlr0096 protein n=1 Tax=Mesorhizobium japonicum (strain LMG 29417 / CECT 9101 / MAFF 303099) TaxID=266835 RepID=Q98NK8_RHILO|nr:mlr0096 [Mesorhizobium japonicum MAFF 303099]
MVTRCLRRLKNRVRRRYVASPAFRPDRRSDVTISMYEASVPVFSTRLKALSNVLAAAEQNALDRKIDPQVFLTARLAPDMFALTRQVQIATDHAKGAPSRLAGREVPKYEDNEASFADLEARIAKTLALLATFSAADIDGSDDKVIELKLGGRETTLAGMQYLLHVAMPNFYFHLTTAYDILRHNGVPLGKATFLGSR